MPLTRSGTTSIQKSRVLDEVIFPDPFLEKNSPLDRYVSIKMMYELETVVMAIA
jgi:hypothetical protein